MSASVEGRQGQQQRPGQQRRDHREERVLGGGRDQGDPAVLDGRQQRVLLGLGEPVHLVDEQHRLPGRRQRSSTRVVDHRAHVLDPGGHRRQLGERAPGRPGHQVSECGLARAGRAPTGSARPPPSRSRPRPAGAWRPGSEHVILADDLVERPRPHADGERGTGRASRRPLAREQVLGHPATLARSRRPRTSSLPARHRPTPRRPPRTPSPSNMGGRGAQIKGIRHTLPHGLPRSWRGSEAAVHARGGTGRRRTPLSGGTPATPGGLVGPDPIVVPPHGGGVLGLVALFATGRAPQAPLLVPTPRPRPADARVGG